MPEWLTIADFTADRVLYRDLHPYDRSLPSIDDLRGALGLPPNLLPRKRDSDYARYMQLLLRHARPQQPAQAVLVVGDTENDRLLAAHLRALNEAAGGPPVYAFLGIDQPASAPALHWDGDTATATRWSLLEPWLDTLLERSAVSPAGLLVLLDIDKTLLGPRGRNDEPINSARAEGALLVARELFGATLDEAAFQQHYATLCEPAYHGMTLDNQDYTVYTALLLLADALTWPDLEQGLHDGKLATFGQVLAASLPHVPLALATLHQTIQHAYHAGDPTPFKQFRAAEFAATVARMQDGRLRLCHELVALLRRLIGQGALCLAASDKPAESALPSPVQAAAGMLPLHRTPVQAG